MVGPMPHFELDQRADSVELVSKIPKSENVSTIVLVHFTDQKKCRGSAALRCGGGAPGLTRGRGTRAPSGRLFPLTAVHGLLF